jgi:Tfp pilus assembly protein PilX
VAHPARRGRHPMLYTVLTILVVVILALIAWRLATGRRV